MKTRAAPDGVSLEGQAALCAQFALEVFEHRSLCGSAEPDAEVRKKDAKKDAGDL